MRSASATQAKQPGLVQMVGAAPAGSRASPRSRLRPPRPQGRTASARAITLGRLQVRRCRAIAAGPYARRSALRPRQVGLLQQLPVDLLDRLAARFDAEEVIDHPRHQEPAAEIEEGRRDLRQRHVGLEIVVGADDQRQPNRADDLADAAEAIGRAHAGGPQMRGPDLRRIGPDNGKAAIGEEEGQRPGSARTPRGRTASHRN